MHEQLTIEMLPAADSALAQGVHDEELDGAYVLTAQIVHCP